MLKFSRSLLSVLAISTATIGAVALPPTYAVAQDVSAANVTIVLYGEGGESKGAYREIAKGQWVELDAAGQIAATFKEVERNDDAVMLEDAGRGVAVTLDLANAQVTFGAIGDDQEVLYEILSTGADPIDGGGKVAEAPAGPAATGLNVKSVIFGSTSGPLGEYRQTGKTKWSEIDYKGDTAFRFDEVARDRTSVKIEDASRGIALTLDIANNVVSYGAIGDAEQFELYQIISTTARATTANSEEIDNYIDSLSYDPRILLREPLDGSTTTLKVQPGRSDVTGEVVVTTATKQDFDKEVESISVLAPLSPDIFPGALVVANGQLVDGNPRPSGLARAPMTLTLSLNGNANGTRLVEDPKKSTVKIAIDDLLKEWQETAGDNTNADVSFLVTKEVEDYTQAQAELGFNAKWAEGSAEGLLKGSGNLKQTTFVAMYKQVFYTISVDTPAVPSDFFAPGVTVDKLARDFKNDGPPAYIDSVTYGRLLLVRMLVDDSEITAEMEGEFTHALSDDDEVSANASAELTRIAKSAKFSAIIIGGKSDQSVLDTPDLDKIQSFIANGANYSAANPGLPIDYSVKFLKDNSLAAIRLVGSYTTYDSKTYPFGFVKIKHTGGMLGRWSVQWLQPSPDGKGMVQGPGETNSNWPNGNPSSSFKVVKIPGDAKRVTIVQELARGINSGWQSVTDTILPNGPDAKCYWMYGTSFFENAVVSSAPGPGDDCKG